MKRQTVLQVCVAALGVHRGALAAANVAQHAMATCELGHVPTATEYAEYWAMHERSAWRHRERVREVFGEDWREVVEAVAAQISDERSPRAVANLSAPRFVAA